MKSPRASFLLFLYLLAPFQYHGAVKTGAVQELSGAALRVKAGKTDCRRMQIQEPELSFTTHAHGGIGVRWGSLLDCERMTLLLALIIRCRQTIYYKQLICIYLHMNIHLAKKQHVI